MTRVQQFLVSTSLILLASVVRAEEPGWTELIGDKGLDAWKMPQGVWKVVGDVELHPDNPKLLSSKAGKGVIYNGPKGRLQWGPQFSYVTRNTWSGKTSIEPHGIDGMVFSSFRYYLP